MLFRMKSLNYLVGSAAIVGAFLFASSAHALTPLSLTGSTSTPTSPTSGLAWYFESTGTQTPASTTPTALPAALPPASAPATGGTVTTNLPGNTAPSYIDTLHRAPGLTSDLSAYFQNGVYITPSMAFAPSSAYPLGSVTNPLTFSPMMSAGPIVFSNLPTAGSRVAVQNPLPLSFSYVNNGAARPVIIQSDVFNPNGVIVSSSTLNSQLNAGENALFNSTLNFTSPSYTADGIYGLRVRALDPNQQGAVLGENFFNIGLQR